MANPELGTKQLCPQCQAKFYDLNKRPAHCPKCAAEFDPDEAVRNRRVRARAIVPDTEADDERPDQVRGKTADAEDEEEEVTTPELDEVADEPLVADDEDEDGVAPVAGADDLGEFTDDEEVEEADDVPFLEEDEDDFDDAEIEGLPGEGDED
ncbi:TIGR02300 family protein [Phenylobacterium sp. LjRoot219]|uniref:TIGR02300 family protein n=1 Tax=Phenylobacterium sp. LjRoot219 TaxID=3342283 RepID=UPI003ED0FC8F